MSTGQAVGPKEGAVTGVFAWFWGRYQVGMLGIRADDVRAGVDDIFGDSEVFQVYEKEKEKHKGGTRLCLLSM